MATNANGLTIYGLGKFILAIDAWTHAQSLDGTCECFGNVDTWGTHVSLVSLKGFPPSTDDVREFGLSEVDLAYLAESEAAIITEDDRGFVTVVYYKDERKADDAFAEEESDYYDSCTADEDTYEGEDS